MPPDLGDEEAGPQVKGFPGLLSSPGQDGNPPLAFVLRAHYGLPSPFSHPSESASTLTPCWAMEGAEPCVTGGHCIVWYLRGAPTESPRWAFAPGTYSAPRLGQVQTRTGRETQRQLCCGRTTPRAGISVALCLAGGMLCSLVGRTWALKPA